MLRAELLKLMTLSASKVALAVGAGGLIVTQLLTVMLLPALASGRIGPGKDVVGDLIPSSDLVSADGQLAALSPLGNSGGTGSLGIAVIAIVLMGVLVGTSDFRFGGIVTTALAQPSRVRILVAKAAAAGVAGFVTGGVFALVSTATLLITLRTAQIPLAIEAAVLACVLVRSVLAISALTIIALAVGILAKSQLTAVLAMFGILIFEMVTQSMAQLITGSMPLWAQLMPLSLTNAVIGTDSAGMQLPVAAAALLVMTMAFLAFAAFALRRRDL